MNKHDYPFKWLLKQERWLNSPFDICDSRWVEQLRQRYHSMGEKNQQIGLLKSSLNQLVLIGLSDKNVQFISSIDRSNIIVCAIYPLVDCLTHLFEVESADTIANWLDQLQMPLTSIFATLHIKQITKNFDERDLTGLNYNGLINKIRDALKEKGEDLSKLKESKEALTTINNLCSSLSVHDSKSLTKVTKEKLRVWETSVLEKLLHDYTRSKDEATQRLKKHFEQRRQKLDNDYKEAHNTLDQQFRQITYLRDELKFRENRDSRQIQALKERFEPAINQSQSLYSKLESFDLSEYGLLKDDEEFLKRLANLDSFLNGTTANLLHETLLEKIPSIFKKLLENPKFHNDCVNREASKLPSLLVTWLVDCFKADLDGNIESRTIYWTSDSKAEFDQTQEDLELISPYLKWDIIIDESKVSGYVVGLYKIPKNYEQTGEEPTTESPNDLEEGEYKKKDSTSCQTPCGTKSSEGSGGKTPNDSTFVEFTSDNVQEVGTTSRTLNVTTEQNGEYIQQARILGKPSKENVSDGSTPTEEDKSNPSDDKGASSSEQTVSETGHKHDQIRNSTADTPNTEDTSEYMEPQLAAETPESSDFDRATPTHKNTDAHTTVVTETQAIPSEENSETLERSGIESESDKQNSGTHPSNPSDMTGKKIRLGSSIAQPPPDPNKSSEK